MSESESEPSQATTIRKIGFCGADDSVSPRMLGLICHSYPFVEFGVLFRPDKEGTPRYASPEWVQRLSKVVNNASSSSTPQKMTLAAHLCGSRVNDFLSGNPQSESFLSTLRPLGFHRVQINATKVNGVDTSKLSKQVETVAKGITAHPELEFILQKNDETRDLWQGLLDLKSFGDGGDGCLPSNVTMLVDESKGTGVLASSWPTPPEKYDIGYAGGIGPKNVKKVLEDVMKVSKGRRVWIDMESSLRSEVAGRGDIFDLDKCYECIEVVCGELGLFEHPNFLLGESE